MDMNHDPKPEIFRRLLGIRWRRITALSQKDAPGHLAELVPIMQSKPVANLGDSTFLQEGTLTDLLGQPPPDHAWVIIPRCAVFDTLIVVAIYELSDSYLDGKHAPS